jgi:dipeptidyl aminopeptidase/acylaminoacyl peptidase
MIRVLSLGCVAATVAAASMAQQASQPKAISAPRTAADFAELPTLERPVISPDGRSIAAKIAREGKLYLAIVNVDGTPPRLIPTGDNDLNWWKWVNNNWLVVGIGDKVPVAGAGEWYVRRVVGVNAAPGGKVVPLAVREAAQQADDVIWTATDGSPRILLALQKSIYVSDVGFWPEVLEVDVSNGRSKIAVRSHEGVMTWVADAQGTVRMGIGQSVDGRTMRVLYRDGAGAPFREIVRPTKRRSEVIVPSLFTADRQRAIAFSEGEDGTDGVYDFDLATLELGRRLYGSKGFDVAGIVTSTSGDAIAAVDYLEDTGRREWIDPDLSKLQAEVSTRVRGGSARVLNYSRDHSRAIVLIGATNSPGSYYFYERASGELHQLGFINPKIGTARLNIVRTIRYKARDGLEISAVLTTPKNKSGKLPLVVMPHGGPFARDSEEWDWWSQFLAERGYAVVQPNYRGSSGYGSAFAKKGEGQWGLAMQDDLIDAIDYLDKQGIADAKRTCIVGASYGGYAALRASQRDATRYRCAVSYAGVSDLGRLRRYDAQFLASGARSDWLKLQATDFRAVSPITTPEHSAIPLLIVHGRRDTVVPVSQSREMVERLKRVGKDVSYVEQPEADHFFTRSEDRLQFLKLLDEFLAKHNPA